jgi:hypothetical protein
MCRALQTSFLNDTPGQFRIVLPWNDVRSAPHELPTWIMRIYTRHFCWISKVSLAGLVQFSIHSGTYSACSDEVWHVWSGYSLLLCHFKVWQKKTSVLSQLFNVNIPFLVYIDHRHMHDESAYMCPDWPNFLTWFYSTYCIMSWERDLTCMTCLTQLLLH